MQYRYLISFNDIIARDREDVKGEHKVGGEKGRASRPAQLFTVFFF